MSGFHKPTVATAIVAVVVLVIVYHILIGRKNRKG